MRQHDGSDGVLIFRDYLVGDRVGVRKYVRDVCPSWDVLWLRFPAILGFELRTEVDLIGVFRWEKDGNECLVS